VSHWDRSSLNPASKYSVVSSKILAKLVISVVFQSAMAPYLISAASLSATHSVQAFLKTELSVNTVVEVASWNATSKSRRKQVDEKGKLILPIVPEQGARDRQRRQNALCERESNKHS
jgi:hypothetical protein